MSARDWCRAMHLTLPGYVDYAMELLEGDGLIFAVHFGTMTAVQMATDRWLDDVERTEKRPGCY